MKMPRSTHTIITLIIAAILSVLFAIGYISMITPNEKQALKYDQQRQADFEKLKTGIQAFYDKREKLPESLVALKEEIERDNEARTSDSLDVLTSLLSYQAVPQRDPYSNKPYTYKFENASATKYQLCTDFFKENKGDDDAVEKGNSATVKHGAGNQCVDFEVDKKTQSNPSFSTPSRSSTGNSEAQLRDTRRKEDLITISSGLEQYYNDNQAYPASLAELLSGLYLRQIPKDPRNNSDYKYTPLPAGSSRYTSFTLQATLENKSDRDIKAGSTDVYEVVNKQ